MAFLMERLRPAAARRMTSGLARRMLLGTDVPALRGGLVGGAAAAGLGLAGVALPMFLLWIVTPYVAGGPGSVVHLAACVWLLGHGAELSRPLLDPVAAATGGAGAHVPVGVSPLLVTALVLVPLYRAGVRAGESGAEREGSSPPASALLGLGVGYLLAGATAAAAAAAGPLSAAPLRAFGWVALVALPVAALGVRRGAGSWGLRERIRCALPTESEAGTRSWPRLPAWVPVPGPTTVPAWARVAARARVAGGAGVAARAAVGGSAALLGGGALVLAVSLLVHFGAAGAVAAQVAPDLAGRLALLLLCATLLPNAAIWAAAYALGPGFALGGQLTPLGAAAVRTPTFPLVAALPAAGHSLLGLLALAVPVVAGGAVAVLVGRAAYEHRHDDEPGELEPDRQGWGLLATAEVALAAAAGTGLVAALFAAASGGALGTGALAHVGPSPWRTGLAALGWAATGVPGALLVRWWISRRAGRATPEAEASRSWRSWSRRPW